MTLPPLNSRRSSTGSWLANRRERQPRRDDVFAAGVRVVSGRVPSLGRRWKFRAMSVDPLAQDGVITAHHGPRGRLRLGPARLSETRAPRANHTVIIASNIDTDATVELSLPTGELHRFGLDEL